MKHLLRILIPAIFVLTLTFLIVAWGRGYRVNILEIISSWLKGQPVNPSKQIFPTGSLVATSDPNGAQVFINGEFKTATNQTLQLPPGEYKVRIEKEGYIPWEKTFIIKKEVAVQTNATLFPTNPSLSPLTSTGVKNLALSPDGTRLVFARVNNATDSARLPGQMPPQGLWVLDLAQRPLPLNRNPKQITISTPDRDWSKAKLIWSPDNEQILAVFIAKNSTGEITQAYLLQANQLNRQPDNVTTTYGEIISAWESLLHKNQQDKLLAFPEKIVMATKDKIKILAFSPDETKLLYQATASATLPEAITPPLLGTNPTAQTRTIEAGKIYVYDAKEDRNYFIMESQEIESSMPDKEISNFQSPISNLQTNRLLIWYSNSHHLILPEKDKITMMEYDGTNRTTVYAGPFEDNFVASWPAGGKLVILTTLNPAASKLPNLYLVNLR